MRTRRSGAERGLICRALQRALGWCWYYEGRTPSHYLEVLTELKPPCCSWDPSPAWLIFFPNGVLKSLSMVGVDPRAKGVAHSLHPLEGTPASRGAIGTYPGVSPCQGSEGLCTRNYAWDKGYVDKGYEAMSINHSMGAGQPVAAQAATGRPTCGRQPPGAVGQDLPQLVVTLRCCPHNGCMARAATSSVIPCPTLL